MSEEIDDNAPNDVAEHEPKAVSSVERIASSMGWKPKELYKGPEDKWADAETFLERTPDVIKDLREKVDRVNKAAQAVIAKEKQKAIKDAQRMLNEAREQGDIDAAIEAQQALNEAQKPDTYIENRIGRFREENPWFDNNVEAAAIAEAASNRIASKGGDVDEQIEAAVKAVKKAMPELFDLDTSSGNPQPKPEPKVPSMQSGQRSANAEPVKKGWANIPADVRKQAETAFIRKGMLTQEEYAKSYWESKE